MGFFEIVISVILAGALISLISIFLLILYALVFGAPFAPLSQNRIETMIKLLNLKKGQKAVDLGSGDGRIVIAIAGLGIETHGYEINPLLVAYSRLKIRKLGLSKKAFIHFKDFWSVNFKDYNAVTIYGISHIMGRLERKLMSELKPGSKIVTNYFKFPKLKPSKIENKVACYIVPKVSR